MTKHHFSAVAAVLASMIGACLSAAPAASPEDSYKESLALGDYDSITYKADDGKELSFADFFKLVSAGREFSIMKNIGKHKAVLSITPIGQTELPEAIPALAIKVGATMPAAALVDLGGTARRLDGSGGRPLLLSFFFASCVPCIHEIPELNAFAKEHREMDVVAVTFETTADAKKFVAKYGLRWPVVADADEYIGTVGVKVYPMLALVAPNGKLVAVESGGEEPSHASASTGSKLEEWVRSSLQAKHN